MKKIITTKNLHIFVIIIGILFNAIGAFHTNVWFDETYSVAMATHNFGDIWNIGGHDVHPVLYYWVLNIINILTGGSIIAYRLFSVICIAILGILGYTHIRKDFGEKTGILFSFFSYFLPSIAIFANEIRMYTMAITLVTILAIYAYRIYKGDTSWKNWIIFELTSLACIYTHYYGLMAAGLINIIMLVNFIKNRRSQSIKRILVFGIIQTLLYIPWLMYFVSQLKHVSNGFWIEFAFPTTLIELLSYQYIGNLNYYLGFAISIILYVYLGFKIFKLIKNKENILPIKLSIGIYLAVILSAVIITLIAGTSILLYRYLFVITGLYIFTLSFIISKEKNKKIVIVICLITAILGIYSNILLIKDNYSNKNAQPIEFINNNIQDGDVFVYTDIVGPGSVIAVKFSNHKQYFYNKENWGVEEAYKAFSPQMGTYTTTDFLNKEELTGRIWIIDGGSDTCYQLLFNNNEYVVLNKAVFETEYKSYNYTITLVQRIMR